MGKETFGTRVRKARAAKGLSATELAALAGLGRQHMWFLETDRRPSPRAATVFALAHALEVSPEWLLTGAGKAHP
ncbi:MAG: helix-turn-helix transcriptional regulator [Solirubrobacterales bacterium]|nr:helix-turn-helix transcriptional regulator [Solirubrobacterales bacterium]